MGMLDGAKGNLNQSVTIAPYSSMNDYAEITYGLGVANDCRIIYQQKKVIDQNGNVNLSHAQIILDGSATVTINDKITLPDASVVKRILGIDTHYSVAGTALYKVVYL